MDKNPYYDPQDFDPPLTQVAFLDLTRHDYTFDLHVVWVTADGRYFTAFDSGCSCPTPFENFTTLDLLTPVTPDVIAMLRQEAADYGQPSDTDRFYDMPADLDAVAEYNRALDAVAAAL